MRKFLTRKRDKQPFPVRRRGMVKNGDAKGVITPTLSATKFSDEYKRIRKERDRFIRKLRFAAFLADKLRRIGVDSVLVGGSAVEVYTDGDFPSADVDFDVTDRVKAIELLENLGFRKEGALWFNSDLGIALDVGDKGYSGDADKLRTLQVGDYKLKVAGVEDLVVNRLYSAKFWKSNPQRDIEEARALLAIFKGKLDNNYLDRIAKKNDVEDFLRNLVNP